VSEQLSAMHRTVAAYTFASLLNTFSMAKATGLQIALLDEPPSPLLDEPPQEASAIRAQDTRTWRKLFAWGAGRLCRQRTIAGRDGNPLRVSILANFIFKHLGTADG
jgi:hypothetical protein